MKIIFYSTKNHDFDTEIPILKPHIREFTISEINHYPQKVLNPHICRILRGNILSNNHNILLLLNNSLGINLDPQNPIKSTNSWWSPLKILNSPIFWSSEWLLLNNLILLKVISYVISIAELKTEVWGKYSQPLRIPQIPLQNHHPSVKPVRINIS